MSGPKGVSRRDFIRTGAAVGGLVILGGAAHGQAAKSFKIGLIGCGGRGRGAISDIMNAGKSLNVDIKVVALADAMPDRVKAAAEGVKARSQQVPEDRCFSGFDAYKKLIATDVEIVLMCTSPNFRPAHFEAAVKAGKHAFVEKPIAVDAPGCRRMLAAGEEAAKKNLAVLAGTCLRHDKGYGAMHQLIVEGAVGRILGGCTYYCTGALWRNPRKEGMGDAEYLVRNWANWAGMSGDHIVEQDVHTIDMQNWCVGSTPVAAVAIGGRHRRQTGDQYDSFSVDYEYADGVHVHNICRQISGCQFNWGNGLILVGEKGIARNDRGVTLWDKTKVKSPDVPMTMNMYVQEHCVFLKSLLDGKPINHVKDVTESTLSAIMGRDAAYTGRRIEWKEYMDPAAKSDLFDKAYPTTSGDFESGKVVAPKDDVVPIPGKA